GKVSRVALVGSVNFENDPVLIAWAVDCRDLSLRKCIVERVVDVLHAHPETCRRLAVDGDVCLQPALLAVGGYVHDTGHTLNAIDNARHPFLQLLYIRTP